MQDKKDEKGRKSEGSKDDFRRERRGVEGFGESEGRQKLRFRRERRENSGI